MKTNISIELTDEERDYIANRIDGKVTKRLATRKEISDLALYIMSRVVSDNPPSIVSMDAIADPVVSEIEDIDRGGWSFIGEPMASS
jgi:hypothetical protein